MARSSGARFVLTLPLRIDAATEHVMLGRLETARRAYNAILCELLDRADVMRESRVFRRLAGELRARSRSAISPPKLVFASPRERADAWNELRERHGLRFGGKIASYTDIGRARYEADKTWIATLVRRFGEHRGACGLGSALIRHELQRRAIEAVEQWLVGVRRRPRPRRRHEPLKTLASSSSIKDAAGDVGDSMRVDRETWTMIWRAAGGAHELRARMRVDHTDPYVVAALERRIVQARVRTEFIRGRRRWFAQLVIEGTSPLIRRTNPGIVGVDVGLQHVAAVGDRGALLARIAPGHTRLVDDRVEQLQRRLSRAQRRNPANAHAVRTRTKILRCPKRSVKRDGRKHRVEDERAIGKPVDVAAGWKRGARLARTARIDTLRAEIAEARRVEAARRKGERGAIVNRILRLGTTVHLERLSSLAWQRSHGATTRSHAPGAFTELLQQLAAQAGGDVIAIDARSAKLSQLCHACGGYTKHPLQGPIAKRFSVCACGRAIMQRDLYSGFLARYAREDGSVDLHAARATWAGALPRLDDARRIFERAERERICAIADRELISRLAPSVVDDRDNDSSSSRSARSSSSSLRGDGATGVVEQRGARPSVRRRSSSARSRFAGPRAAPMALHDDLRSHRANEPAKALATPLLAAHAIATASSLAR